MRNTGRNRLWTLTAAATLLLAGCAALPGAPKQKDASTVPAAAVMEDHVIRYQCDDGRNVEVTLKGTERAALKINGAVAELRAVRAASGAKYESADKGLVFWSKGGEATIETMAAAGRKIRMTCGQLAKE